MIKHARFVCLLGLFVCLSGGLALSQTTTGSIQGTVKDSTGAVLPGAKVVILNQETGISRNVIADAAGRYSATSLGLGNYRITGSLEGFQTVARSGIELTVGREAVVDLALPVGAVSQTVEVAGEAPSIETTNATISSLVSQEQIRELPLNGRSYAALALLNPGVLQNRTTGSSANDGFGQRISINGSRHDANLFLLDGTASNDAAGNSSTASEGSLGVEGIREFRMITHNMTAEYGRNSGGVFSVVTRSGTNQFHGSAYEYVRNNIFDARDFFNPGDLPAFRRNQFGASVGGPIRKDRIFFFSNYEGMRERRGNTVSATVPTVDARRGLLPLAAATCTNATTGGTVAGPGLCQVPLSPRILPYLSTFPLPNVGVDFGDGTARYSEDFSGKVFENYYMNRGDFRLGDNDNAYVRFIYNPSNRTRPAPLPMFFNVDRGNHYASIISETHVFSGSSINDFRFSFNRTENYGDATQDDRVPTDAALSFVPGFPLGVMRVSAANINSGSLSEWGVGRNSPAVFIVNRFNAANTFTMIRGAHSLKFGIDIERQQDQSVFGSDYKGVFQFGSMVSLLAAAPSRFDGADMSRSTRERGYRRTLYAWFVQDDFRIRSNLTLNLGFRHEFLTDPAEVGGRIAGLRSLLDPTSTLGPAFEQPKTQFGPRVGMAWDPTGSGRTSVRAGVGIYHNQVVSRQWTRLAASEPRFFFGYRVNNPLFPYGTPAVITPDAAAGSAMQYDLDTPTAIHYSFDVQRQVTSTLTAKVGYVGTYGYNFLRVAFPNTRIPTILPNGTKFFPATGPSINPNFSTIEMVFSDSHNNYNAIQAALQKSATGGLSFGVAYTFSKALSDSDVSSNRAVDNVGSFVTMEWDNLKRDYSRSAFDQRHTLVLNSQYELPFNQYLTNGVSKALLGGWTINGILQAGSGMPLTASMGFNNSRNGDPRAPDRPNEAVGGNNNPTHGVTTGCRNEDGSVAAIPAGQKLRTPERWFDPCAFTLPAAGTFGTVGRATMDGPGFFTVDFTLAKKTTLGEGKQLEFRAEFFNLLNHANFHLPQIQVFTDQRIHAGNEGSISAIATPNRQIQLGLKLVF